MAEEAITTHAATLACILASLYLVFSGYRLAGLILLLGFLLHAQGIWFWSYFDVQVSGPKCLKTVEEYQACLPQNAQFSLALGQIAPFFMALGIALIPRPKLRVGT
ncbi:MAG: hypothetical protein CME36_12070 [unclassified Hahellaceae]|nr:hypothetical protein [Hahellaceae bacterium]|tara:strand:+ start:4629 stop:4946 length:318 start_codon:yes stop_codon:yes gene_type:complete